MPTARINFFIGLCFIVSVSVIYYFDPSLSLLALLEESMVLIALIFFGSVFSIIFLNAQKSTVKSWLATFIVQLVVFVTLFFFATTPLFVLLQIGLFFLNVAIVSTMRDYYPHGALLILSCVSTLLLTSLWGLVFLLTLEVSLLTSFILYLFLPLGFLMFASGILQVFETYDVLARRQWKEDREGTADDSSTTYSPRVVLQVPTYAEPPDLVIETLSILSSMDYDNFEVWVIDNNTKDEALWKPVEAYCNTLGPRFNFLHIDNLSGAKAGALNYLLANHTSEEVEIVGVIDADYHARTDFLKNLVPYFKNPAMGFVQTPHDYRDWENNLYQKMCYYEYKLFFVTTMMSLNERDTALTVGTMCLIRKQALDDAGRWAEWCVTEDSELAIRIHAVGYTGVYLPESYGKGLIPDSFSDYKKQRYRWMAGPVQEFYRHWRLLLPIFSHPKSSLNFTQRLHHFHHGLHNCIGGLTIPFIGLSIILVLSLIQHNEIINIPFSLFIVASVTLAGKIILELFLYYKYVGASLLLTVGAMVANSSLQFTASLAGLKTMITPKTPWVRTNKFKSNSAWSKMLAATWMELTLTLFLTGIVIWLFIISPTSGLHVMILIGVLYKVINYAMSPLFNLLSFYYEKID